MTGTKNPPVCDYEGSDYQTTFWDQADRAYEDAVEQVALRRLLPSSGQLMLELGAGAGRNTKRYAGYDKVVLLDYSKTQLQQAQKRLSDSGNTIFVAADVYRLPFVSDLFDGATMIRTLHHMADPLLALSQVHGVMREKGVFILEYANKRNLKSIFRYWAGKQKWNPFTAEAVEFARLNFDFHPKTVRSWLKTAGFHLERQLTVSHYRMNLLKKTIPLKVLVAMDSFAQLSGNLWQLSPSVFTRSNATGTSPQPHAEAFYKCPRCGNPVEDTPPQLICRQCGSQYPVEDGIYDFRLEEDD